MPRTLVRLAPIAWLALLTGFGSKWSRVTLVPTIADRAGAEVPFAYGASVN